MVCNSMYILYKSVYFAGKDPCIIDGLATVLGDAGLNVATFNLGRAEEGGEALALIEVDQPPPQCAAKRAWCSPLYSDKSNGKENQAEGVTCLPFVTK